MTAGVHDGVTVRHVCCSVHNCTESLLSQRDHFCQSHHHLAKECCVDNCTLKAEPGHRTCGLQSHRDFQAQAELRNTAMFQLHSRLRNVGVPQVPLAGTSLQMSAASQVPSNSSLEPSTGTPIKG
ncbi:hypothetical protein GGX14DRAFT_678513, partial [Mycena pura]